jgi:putative transcriptional regulator
MRLLKKDFCMRCNMSKIINAMLETAKDLRMDTITIKEIEILNLVEIKTIEPSEIKKTRLREKVSQAVMAKILNVTPSTYQKWERGELYPRGGNLKLLWLVHNHGIHYIL